MKKLLLPVCLLLFSCHERTTKVNTEKHIVWKKPTTLSYQLAKGKELSIANKNDLNKLAILYAVNRTDSEHFAQLNPVIIPGDLTGDIAAYLPFPFKVAALSNINKIIFFSYPSQTFGAYEHGDLVYTGPTNMGRKADPTPIGFFYSNWKAKETTSTFNDEWDLKWNFNVKNKEGVGWHQYSMTGYPTSHSCMRLLEKDAKYLYSWANQWVLKGKDSIIAQGTPVIIFGSYNFDAPKPWMQLTQNPHALDISETQLQSLITPHLKDILHQQEIRDSL